MLLYPQNKITIGKDMFLQWTSSYQSSFHPPYDEKRNGSGPYTVEKPLRQDLLSQDGLILRALSIAEQYKTVPFSRWKAVNIYRRFTQNVKVIDQTYNVLREYARNDEPLTPGGEWLLDNYHIIDQHVRDIKVLFPRGFYRSLPLIKEGPFEGFLRVYFLAVEYLSHTDSVVDPDSITNFIQAYQSNEPLSIGELWAFPIMLRFALLENLRRLSEVALKEKSEQERIDSAMSKIEKDKNIKSSDIMILFVNEFSQKDSFSTTEAAYIAKKLRMLGDRGSLALEWFEQRLRESGQDLNASIAEEHRSQAANRISIGNTVTSLKRVSREDWKKWFEANSRVDAVLRLDPSEWYSLCDFETHDRYRDVIEKYSKKTGISEVAIAEKILEACSSNLSDKGETDKKRHVGYYLIGEGKHYFEQEIGYKPSFKEKIGRISHAYAFPIYICAILCITLLIILPLCRYAFLYYGEFWALLSLLLMAIPVSDLAINIVNWVVSNNVPPFFLPKLDLKDGVPTEMKTAVVVHGILESKDVIEKLVDSLEVRFVANRDDSILFGLLLDLHSSNTETLPEDEPLIKYAEELVSALREKHSCAPHQIFVLVRRRVWHESEGEYLGWERKRGKLTEFNRIICGEAESTTFLNLTRELKEELQSVKYVITLDADTSLPINTAKQLIGAIAHPLNQPEFDPETGRVVAGYGIIQPRVSVEISSGTASWFAWFFSGYAGLDPYTSKVSEVSQDIFDESYYLGKGIYNVRAFERALHNRVPEQSLLSHDMFEGLFARVAFASDIELTDDFPSRYVVYAKRYHRWVRGDWQLIPWLKRRVPDASRKPYINPFSAIGRWKIFDNLRRSLVAPLAFLSILISWIWLSDISLYWSLIVLIILTFPVYAQIANTVMAPPVGLSITAYAKGIGSDLFKTSLQALFTVAVLPHQALLMLHAISVTLYRLTISKRKLLEWQTAAQSEQQLSNTLWSYHRMMLPALAIVLAALAASDWDSNIFLRAFFGSLWILSPSLAFIASKPKRNRKYTVSPHQEETLLEIAFDTWRFFDEFICPETNYLIVDNIQLDPKETVAYRTSPTNIGLSLMAVISASDLGFIAPHSAYNRIKHILATIERMEKFRGHLYNWYDVKTLSPLPPKYISSVDSGNFVSYLITLRQALAAIDDTPALTGFHIRNIHKELIALKEKLGKTSLQEVERALEVLRLRPIAQNTKITIEDTVKVGREIYTLFDALEEVGNNFQRHRHTVDAFRKQIDELFLPKCIIEAFSLPQKILFELGEKHDLSSQLLAWRERVNPWLPTYHNLLFALDGLKAIVEQTMNKLDRPEDKAITALLEKAAKDCESGRSFIIELIGGCKKSVEQISKIENEVDFAFLYNEDKFHFSIGYSVDNAKPDSAGYDLLASEARITSLLAIARGEVPAEHWFRLGRSLAEGFRGKALISWSGTMFEYLMPRLVLKDFPETLLSESMKVAVKTQRQYCRSKGIPWGMSESGYAGVDFNQAYQYKAFGIPELGLKRGLGEGLVISPYSTMLALMIDFENAYNNISVLEKEGLRGRYGFFEACDYTPSRLKKGEKKHIVRSFLAHHQGMSLASINNILNNDILVERFHSDISIKAVERLLQERFPLRIPAISLHPGGVAYFEREPEEDKAEGAEIISTPLTPIPRTRIISNKRLSVIVDNTGSGATFYSEDIALTRWRPDKALNNHGIYIYVRDLDSGKLWSAAYQPLRVDPDYYEAIFNPEKIEFKQRKHGVTLHTEITVSPEDNVEIRRVTATNLSSKSRNLEFTSYGEVVIGDAKGDLAHPAFSKMFVETEFLPEFDAITFKRRPRLSEERKLYMFHKVSMKTVWAKTTFDSSRFSFIGRGRTPGNPIAFDDFRELSGNEGVVLDPIMALRVPIELAPGGTESITFITGIAQEKEELARLLERYHDIQSVNRAFELAWSYSNVELRYDQFTIAQTHLFQKVGNAVLFPIDSLRGREDALTASKLSQSSLWRFGISGDFPIVLVKLTAPEHRKLAIESILCHDYLRTRGLKFDLVILNEYQGGYLQDFQNELDSYIKRYGRGRIEEHGGIFLRSSTQLSQDEIILLESVAKVVLYGEKGPLAKQLEIDEFKVEYQESKEVPRPRKRELSLESIRLLPKLEFFNGLGGFADRGKSYFIRLEGEHTPLPWSNVISNRDFGFIVTESGGGYTWAYNSREFRLTPWSNDPVEDPVGECIYMRDGSSGDYWSLTPCPAGGSTQHDVKHGMGYTSFLSEVSGIETTLTISGATDEMVKWWKVTLRNNNESSRHLELYLYIDWVLGVLKEDTTCLIHNEYYPEEQVLTAVNYFSQDFGGKAVFIGSSEPIDSYTTDRAEFIGINGLMQSPKVFEDARGINIPALMIKGVFSGLVELKRREGRGYDSCGVLKISLDLEEQEEKDLLFFIGCAENVTEALKKARIYKSLDVRDTEFYKTTKLWNQRCSSIEIQTPNRALDILVNSWLQYQNISCRFFGRSAFYQSGGAYGFRDQLQDCMALMYVEPEFAREHILYAASRQFVEGDVQHWWHPPSGKGVRTRISDDYLWLPFVVSHYLDVTGDDSILDEEVPFLEGPHLEEYQSEAYIVPHESTHKGTLYHHCVICCDRALHFGKHGLPFIGAGDWNDGMNKIGVLGEGESVWLGWFLYHVLMSFQEIARLRKDNYRSEQFRKKASELKDALETNGWDGKWYRRAYFDDGTPVGSAASDECKIDSISQSWSVISGAGDKARQKTAMESVYEHLVDRKARIIKLLDPPFHNTPLEPGYIKGYLPGLRENGGQYTHAAAWVILASILLGQSDRAMELFDMVNPITHTETVEQVRTYMGEPYVTCGDVYSSPAHLGRAGWSWYTGSCGWLYRVAVEYIIGLKIRKGKLYFEPSVPGNWRSFSVKYKRNKASFNITFSNPHGVNSGVKEIYADGHLLEKGYIELDAYDGEVEIKVVMGASS
ncbi:MAG: DUF3131 domain-containing protein [Candidatus Dadabacteria bacterium]|nr:MAG: DUF3131 domain-containing protein [Candidatus Dadabacteria bacterium]